MKDLIVSHVEGLGDSLKATRDFAIGDIVLTEKPHFLIDKRFFNISVGREQFNIGAGRGKLLLDIAKSMYVSSCKSLF